MRRQDPHANPHIMQAGAPIDEARLVAVMLHGRGAGAQDILNLSEEFSARDVAYLAPQAAGNTWYPYSFLMPIEQNEPSLSSALRVIETLLASLAEKKFTADRVALMGFSQGACLTLEFAARHAQRYALVAAFSGGLIGPPGTARNYSGSFDGTPVFLGCSDIDPHIPVERVHESADVFTRMGATVTKKIYPHMGHTINESEIDIVDELLSKRSGGSS
ncbi:MAG TPA: dienelactone hydrolase family protein [Vicinamibacterales bacterium]|nr:dienelactone hydrolase family protein [Vicinamibacterales bacterium]